jgi:hypothetical protein
LSALTAALEREAATSAILRSISRSPTDLQRILDTIAESAARLCDATDAVIHQVDRDILARFVAHFGPIAEARDRTHRKSSCSFELLLEGRQIDAVLPPAVRFDLGNQKTRVR